MKRLFRPSVTDRLLHINMCILGASCSLLSSRIEEERGGGKKSCQWCIYNVEVNKPCSVWHAICPLSNSLSRQPFVSIPNIRWQLLNAASTRHRLYPQQICACGIIYRLMPPAFCALCVMGLCIQSRRGCRNVALLSCVDRQVVSHGTQCFCISLRNVLRDKMNDKSTNFTSRLHLVAHVRVSMNLLNDVFLPLPVEVC